MRLFLSMAIGIGCCLGTMSADAQTLFTYGSNKVSKEEFLRVYQKNNAQKKPDFSKASVDEYLNLYSLFKMKVKEAESMRLDTLPTVTSELNTYKAQLARTYLSDKEVTNTLAHQAYDRMKEEVRVSHILVAVRPNDDTAKAYQKIDSIYKAITQQKADFATLAKQYSDDKGSGANGGDIGYISALQVVYPFENAAYNTAVGQVSAPFRTQFGFHILKVADKRKSQGQVEVAQIMIASSKSKGEAGIKEAETKILDIKKQIKAGASFEEMAQKYSDDKFSKDKGGHMEPFGVGKLMPSFEKAAFALNKPGDLSEPVVTDYGVHLIKLIKKMPLQSYDELKDNITRRVENDSRATVAKEAYQEKVKQKLGFKEYPENLSKLIAALPADSAKNRSFKASDFSGYTAPLFELANKKYSQYDFMRYAGELTRGNIMGNKLTTIGDLYRMYQTNTVNELQQAELEKNNPEYRNLIGEYRDGILLFDLMDKNVWTRAAKDSAGLTTFYNQNKTKYQWKPGFEGTVYQSASDVDLNLLKKELEAGLDAEGALEKLGKGESPVHISQQSGRFEFDRFPVDKSIFKEGKASTIFKNEDGSFTMVYAHKLFSAPEDKSLEDARGFAVADYQDYLEKQWNKELKAKYPLDVDEKVLKTIVKK